MAVRSARLYAGPTPVVGAFSNVYTVPAGVTTLLKEIVCALTSSSATSAFLRIASGATEVNMLTVSGSFPLIVRMPCWTALEPGTTIGVWQSVTNGASWYVSGAELVGVAP